MKRRRRKRVECSIQEGMERLSDCTEIYRRMLNVVGSEWFLAMLR